MKETMIECITCYYHIGRNKCSSPGIYAERFCNWRNRNNNCGDYFPRVRLTDKLKQLETETGIVSEIILDTTTIIFGIINSR
jgi:hypothetical protein